jgi:hypothetical protein
MFDNAKSIGEELDLENPAIFKTYFRELYFIKGAERIPALREQFHFKGVDSLMNLIDEEGGKNVVVHYGASGRCLEKLKKYGWSKGLSRKLQLYTVRVRKNDFNELDARGFLDKNYSWLNILSPLCEKSGYDNFLGLLPAGEIEG